MDIREVVRTSEFYALLAAFVLSVLAHNKWLVDPDQAQMWVVALVTYGGSRFIGKTAKASIPSNGGVK
jgi:hypothetical protein